MGESAQLARLRAATRGPVSPPAAAPCQLDAGWTAWEDDSLVLVTLVIRLVPERLADGKFVGEVEHVRNGESQFVTGVSDLVGFAQRAAADTQGPKPGPRGRPDQHLRLAGQKEVVRALPRGDEGRGRGDPAVVTNRRRCR